MQNQIDQLNQRIIELEAQLAESKSLPTFNDIDYTRLRVTKVGLSDDPTYIKAVNEGGAATYNVLTTPALFAKIEGTNYFIPVYIQSNFII